MDELLLSKTAVTVYEIFIILILITLLIRQSKKNKEAQERPNISEAKMRNAKLEDRRRNP